MIRSVLGFAFAACCLLPGCGRPAAPTPATRTARATATAPTAAAPGQAAQPDAARPSAPASKASADAGPTNHGTQAAPAVAPPAGPPPAEPKAERLLVLLPGGPLIVDAHLTLDGRAATAQFEELVAQVTAAADADQDGRPTWKEFFANAAFQKSPLGAGNEVDDYQANMYIENHDANRDGVVQGDEARSWLGRNGSRGADAFAVRSSQAYPPDPRAASRVWHMVDADDDGRLSGHEMRRAGATLLAADANDDLTIEPAELATLREQLAARRDETAIQQDANRPAALALSAESDAERVAFLLADFYAPRQALGPDSFPAFPALFDALDVDHDEALDQIDVNRIRRVPAHLELDVAFRSGPSGAEPAAAITVRRSSEEIELIGAPLVDSVTARVDGVLLAILAADLAPGAAADQSPERRQVRALVHDQCDALFQELDQDADGRLGERELAAATDRLAGRDANGDGALSADELPRLMVAAFLRSEPAGEMEFYVPAAASRAGAAAKGPAWFAQADFNGDGDVSRREFLGVPAAFARLDANADGFIDAAEASARSATEDAAP